MSVPAGYPGYQSIQHKSTSTRQINIFYRGIRVSYPNHPFSAICIQYCPTILCRAQICNLRCISNLPLSEYNQISDIVI
eukprot:390380-Rhodomonas_salina.1